VTANEDCGLFGNLWMYITGERRERRGNAAALITREESEQRALKELTSIIEALAERGLGSRAKVLKSDA
jgi:hypothetical protein